MRYHLEDWWPAYTLATVFILAMAGLFSASVSEAQRRAACLDQGEVLVDVDGLKYCTNPMNLRRIK